MNVDRRAFLAEAAAFGAATGIPHVVFGAGAESDWKAAFRQVGFDPEAAGSSFVVVTSDVHCPGASHLDEHVAIWNGLNPRPAAVIVLGDLGYVNGSFGAIPDEKWLKTKARPGFEEFRAKVVDVVRKDVPLKLVLGNHDTHPGEKDSELFREYFPEHPLTETFEIAGVRFIKLNGRPDGNLGDGQRTWFKREAKRSPQDRALVVLVHQPSVGMTSREYDIGASSLAALAERTGETWLWGGHIHRNEYRVYDLPKTRYRVAAHARDSQGFWLYGLRDGKVAARLWWAHDGMPEAKAFGTEAKYGSGRIRLPFDGMEREIVWKCFVGEPAERAARQALEGGDNLSWFYYLKTVTYRFHKASVAPAATRLALLGTFLGHRKDPSRKEKFQLSCDGKAWVEVARTGGKGDVWTFEIPETLCGSADLWLKIDAFGYGCEDSLTAIALLA